MLNRELLKRITKATVVGVSFLSLTITEAGRICSYNGCQKDALPNSAFCGAHSHIKPASPEIQMQTQERLAQEQQARAAEVERQKQAKTDEAFAEKQKDLNRKFVVLEQKFAELETLGSKIQQSISNGGWFIAELPMTDSPASQASNPLTDFLGQKISCSDVLNVLLNNMTMELYSQEKTDCESQQPKCSTVQDVDNLISKVEKCIASIEKAKKVGESLINAMRLARWASQYQDQYNPNAPYKPLSSSNFTDDPESLNRNFACSLFWWQKSDFRELLINALATFSPSAFPVPDELSQEARQALQKSNEKIDTSYEYTAAACDMLLGSNPENTLNATNEDSLGSGERTKKSWATAKLEDSLENKSIQAEQMTFLLSAVIYNISAFGEEVSVAQNKANKRILIVTTDTIHKAKGKGYTVVGLKRDAFNALNAGSSTLDEPVQKINWIMDVIGNAQNLTLEQKIANLNKDIMRPINNWLTQHHKSILWDKGYWYIK